MLALGNSGWENVKGDKPRPNGTEQRKGEGWMARADSWDHVLFSVILGKDKHSYSSTWVGPLRSVATQEKGRDGVQWGLLADSGVCPSQMLMSVKILRTVSMACVLTPPAATSATALRTSSLTPVEWAVLVSLHLPAAGELRSQYCWLGYGLGHPRCQLVKIFLLPRQLRAGKSPVVILPSGLDTHGHVHTQFDTRAYLLCPVRNIQPLHTSM